MEEISIIFTKRWNCINIRGPTTIILWMTMLSNEYVSFDERGNCLSIVDKCVDCYVINFAYLTFEWFSWIIDDYNSPDEHIEVFTWTEFNRTLRRQITEVSRLNRKCRKADNRICHEISFWLTVTLKLIIIEHSLTLRHCKTINKQRHKTFSLNFSKNHCINSQRDTIFQHLTIFHKRNEVTYFTSISFALLVTTQYNQISIKTPKFWSAQCQ